MIKVLHNWYPTMTIQTKHLREITHENNHCDGKWTQELDNEFKQIKHSLSKNLQLNPYNPDLPTQLFTDASKEWGFGFVLSQTDNQHTYIINCGSTVITKPQKNYSIFELELNALAWALQKNTSI